MKLNKIVIFGVGLIGGSFALAMKKAGCSAKITGIGRNPENLRLALDLGIIDEIGSDLPAALAGADLVLIATPVAQIQGILEKIAPHLDDKTVVFDAGSTKEDVVACARSALRDKFSRFVPAHPIAGAENSGAAAAEVDLYQGRKVVLTPVGETSPEAVAQVKAVWELCGAQVRELDPALHDRIFAAVSHLPHLLSFALVHDLASRPERETFLDYAASGFRDFTRIAASSPEMWRDIALANRGALLGELGRYMQELETLQQALAQADAKKLEEIFSLASSVRSAWSAK